MDFLRALSPIGSASSSSTSPAAAPLDATTAGNKQDVFPLHIRGHRHIKDALLLHHTGQQLQSGLSPASSNGSTGGSKKQEGDKSTTWENAREMKRMLKVTVSV